MDSHIAINGNSVPLHLGRYIRAEYRAQNDRFPARVIFTFAGMPDKHGQETKEVRTYKLPQIEEWTRESVAAHGIQLCLDWLNANAADQGFGFRTVARSVTLSPINHTTDAIVFSFNHVPARGSVE